MIRILHHLSLFSLFFIIFTQNRVYASEIAYLPTEVTGDVPSFMGTKEEAGEELAHLSRHYLKLEYYAEILSAKSMMAWDKNQSKTDSNLNLLCMEWEVHFVAFDSLDFGNPNLIQTEIYNCKTKGRTKISSQLKSNFVLSLAKHIEKSFRFLPPNVSLQQNKPTNTVEMNFLIDINGSYAYYKKDLVKVIQGFVDSPNILLGVYSARKDKTIRIPATIDHTEIKNYFEDLQWSGNNSGETILDLLKSLLANAKSQTKAERKNYILFSGSVKDKETALIQTLNQIRQLGYQNTIILTNHVDLSVMRSLQRIAKSSSSRIFSITDYQTVGTVNGNYAILLKEGRIYSTKNSIFPPFRFEEDGYQKWDPGLVRSYVPDLNPYTMAEAFEKLVDFRVLEKRDMETDLTSLFAQEFEKRGNDSSEYKTVLVTMRGESFWIRLPINEAFVEGKEYLILTEFSLDPLSSYGIQNHPGRTKLLKPNSSYPKLLGVLPSQGKKFIETNGIQRFHGYILGTISASKRF